MLKYSVVGNTGTKSKFLPRHWVRRSETRTAKTFVIRPKDPVVIIRGKLFEWSCHDDGKTTIIDGNGKAKCPGTLLLFSSYFLQPRKKGKGKNKHVLMACHQPLPLTYAKYCLQKEWQNTY